MTSSEVQSEGSEASVRSRSSVDAFSVTISFKCCINRSGIMWKSILLGKVPVNDAIVKVVSGNTKKINFLLEQASGSSDLHTQLLTCCANSVSFLNLSIDLIFSVLQGNVCEKLHAAAMSLIQLIKDSWTVAGTLMRKHLLTSSSLVQLFLASTQDKSLSSLNEIKIVSLKVILSMMFHYINKSSNSMSTEEARCCLVVYDVLAESPVMWISLLAKASTAVILHTVCNESSNSAVAISDAAFDVLSEYILETVGSSRDHYNGCSTIEVLKVYLTLIFQTELNRQNFEQSSLLSEQEVVTYIEEYESVHVQEDTGNASEWIHEELLSDFVSPMKDDPEGYIFAVNNMLMAIQNIFSTCRGKYSLVSVEKINTIKTLVVSTLEAVADCEKADVIKIANFIAHDNTLIEVLTTLLNSKGRLIIPAYGILISMTVELLLIACIQYSSICCDKIADVGGLYLMVNQIKEEAQRENYNKVTEIILKGHLTILFKTIRPNPYSSISKIDYGNNISNLIPLTNSPDVSLRICLKMFFSVLPVVTDPTELPSYMNLKPDEVSELLSLLDKATSKQFVMLDYSAYTLAELLSSLIVFAKMASNSLLLHSTGITRLLFKVLESQHYDIQRMGLELVISLLQCSSVCQDIFTSHLDLVSLIKFLDHSPNVIISILARNVVSHYQWNLDDGPEECHYLYAYGCYLVGQYEKGIGMLGYCAEKHTSCKLFLGKLLFHQYRKEQRVLEYEKKYFTTQDIYSAGRIKNCYNNASKVITTFAFCISCGVIDEEAYSMLNKALMDYVRETTGLKEIKFCYICFRRSPVRKSHLCPQSVFKIISENVNKMDASRTGYRVTSLTNRHLITTPKTEAKWLMCDSCEQKLSRNGEQQFVSLLFHNVFPEVKSSNIEYGIWLYEFCVGLFFRCLSGVRNFGVSNESEVFKFIQACRKFLNDLEETDVNTRAAYLKEWEFFIYVNVVPSFEKYTHRAEVLCSLLYSCYTVQLSLYDLISGTMGTCHTVYFAMIIIGNVTFIVKFKPDKLSLLPESYNKISACEGVLKVPNDKQRWDDLLPGVATNIKDAVNLFQSRNLEIEWGKIKLAPKDRSMLPADCDHFSEDDTSRKFGSLSVSANTGAFSKFLEESIVTVNLLPEGFSLNKDLGTVSLPQGHVIMYHIHEETTKNALFLSSGLKHDGYDYYGIVVQNNVVGKQEMIYGFHFDMEKEDILTFFMSTPVEGSREIFMKLYVEAITPLMSKFRETFGGFTAFAHIGKLNRVCNEPKWISLDSKCPSKLCWYCIRRCHNCMRPAMLWFTTKESGKDYSHCSEHCQKLHFSKVAEIPIQAEMKFNTARQPQDERLLLVTTCVLPTKMSPNTILCLHIGLSKNHHSLKVNVPYCVLQLRTITRNLFLSFYITAEQAPGDPLWYCQHPDTVESINNIRSSGKVQEALSLGLKKLECANLASIIVE